MLWREKILKYVIFNMSKNVEIITNNNNENKIHIIDYLSPAVNFHDCKFLKKCLTLDHFLFVLTNTFLALITRRKI